MKRKKIHQSYKHLSVKWKRLLNLSFQWPGRSSASCDPLPSFNGACRGQKRVYTRAAEIYAVFNDLLPWSQRLSFILYWQILRRESLLKFFFFLLARSAESASISASRRKFLNE